MASTKNFLDTTGVGLLWAKIKLLLADKVDKETGKGLSSNDYTAEEKTKLANVAAGAQVNVLEGIQKNGQTVTITNKIANITVPTATSDLTNDSNFAVDANYTHTDNNYTTAEKNKLSAIEASADVNVIETVKVNGSALIPDANKAVDVTVPTSTSDLTNDGDGNSPFATQAYVGTNGGKIDTISVNGTAQTITNKNVNITVPTKTSDITNDSGYITTADIPEGAAASTTSPKMDGTATVGTELAFARGDHIHPTDTSRAPLASPAFTGTPTAPTATTGTNSTQVATTAFVNATVEAAQVGAAMFQGTVNANTTISNSDYKKGYYWIVATAGTYVGDTCEVGDMVFAIADKGASYSASDFSVVQTNINMVALTSAEIDAICV